MKLKDGQIWLFQYGEEDGDTMGILEIHHVAKGLIDFACLLRNVNVQEDSGQLPYDDLHGWLKMRHNQQLINEQQRDCLVSVWNLE